MLVGVPKEIKPQENRIGLTPDRVKTLVSEGHEVIVENNGGFEAGFDNDQYKKAGAKIINKVEDIFNDAEIIVKVKEPLSNEVKMIRENQIIFTYLHLAAAKELTEHDALGTHIRDVLGINKISQAKPIQAAFASLAAFTAGGLLPFLVTLFMPLNSMEYSLYLFALFFLIILGALAAKTGGSSIGKAIIRITFWGTVAMGLTALVGYFFGVNL